MSFWNVHDWDGASASTSFVSSLAHIDHKHMFLLNTQKGINFHIITFV